MRRAIGQIRDYLFGGGYSDSVSNNAAAVTRQTVFGQEPPRKAINTMAASGGTRSLKFTV